MTRGETGSAWAECIFTHRYWPPESTRYISSTVNFLLFSAVGLQHTKTGNNNSTSPLRWWLKVFKGFRVLRTNNLHHYWLFYKVLQSCSLFLISSVIISCLFFNHIYSACVGFCVFFGNHPVKSKIIISSERVGDRTVFLMLHTPISHNNKTMCLKLCTLWPPLPVKVWTPQDLLSCPQYMAPSPVVRWDLHGSDSHSASWCCLFSR